MGEFSDLDGDRVGGRNIVGRSDHRNGHSFFLEEIVLRTSQAVTAVALVTEGGCHWTFNPTENHC